MKRKKFWIGAAACMLDMLMFIIQKVMVVVK